MKFNELTGKAELGRSKDSTFKVFRVFWSKSYQQVKHEKLLLF